MPNGFSGYTANHTAMISINLKVSLIGLVARSFAVDTDMILLLCPTGAKINGELFLEFTDDEELVEQLNLSFAFKRLVKKKAKEVHNN